MKIEPFTKKFLDFINNDKKFVILTGGKHNSANNYDWLEKITNYKITKYKGDTNGKIH